MLSDTVSFLSPQWRRLDLREVQKIWLLTVAILTGELIPLRNNSLFWPEKSIRKVFDLFLVMVRYLGSVSCFSSVKNSLKVFFMPVNIHNLYCIEFIFYKMRLGGGLLSVHGLMDWGIAEAVKDACQGTRPFMRL